MITFPQSAYGLLLTFDGYGADTKRCADTGQLYRFLFDLPSAIGMRRLGFPHIVRVDEPGICGLSGFVFIMESHISIHTYKERGFVTADIYSCRVFDTDHARAMLTSFFKTTSHDAHVIVRGKTFAPRSPTDPRQRKRPRKDS
jgi:S-adenosylmethionine decarboxylase